LAVVSTIRKNFYQDSLKLMQISRELIGLPGVKNASAIMATEANLKMLRDAGLIGKLPEVLNANDMVVAIDADSEQLANEAITKLDSFLLQKKVGVVGEVEYRNLQTAFGASPQTNFVLISVPGQYAKLEVAKAIEYGLHTFLFSDNMPIEEEIQLKIRARERRLLMMGPGCGTAIINGVGFGFSNVINKGPIGVISAAGTGMQEVTSLINNWGSGISQAIGLGGRDLSEKVGGIMAIEAIKMLQNDEGTEVLLLVSKPPSDKVAKKVIKVVLEGEKPAVICFLGMKLGYKAVNTGDSVLRPSSQVRTGQSSVRFSSTLEEAATEALSFVKGSNNWTSIISDKGWKKQAERLIKSINANQRYLRGLFSGGTLCYEAQQVLTPILGKVYSNAPLVKDLKLEDSNESKRHTCVDMGEEEFTIGRPHPMIDSTIRSERLIQEALVKDVSVILFDVVLGYAASPDPAGDLLPAIIEAKKVARKKGRSIAFVAHVCGTERDPQVLGTQEEKLKRLGVLVLPTNASASRVAGWITTRGKKMQDIRINMNHGS